MKKNIIISVFAALMLAHCVTTEAAARVNLAGSVWVGNFDGQAFELVFNADSTITAKMLSGTRAEVADWTRVSVYSKAEVFRDIPSECWKRNIDGSVSTAVIQDDGEAYAVTLGLAGLPDDRGRNNWYIVEGHNLAFQAMIKEDGAKFYLTAIRGNSDVSEDVEAIQVKAAGVVTTIRRIR